MSLRVGYNIHNKTRGGQERSAEEKVYLPQMLQNANSSAIVVMDAHELASDLFHLLPNTIVCNRQSNKTWEGKLWEALSPEQYVINQAGITKSGMPLYVLNEMDSKAPPEQLNKACKWMARVMDLLALKGALCVIDNQGPQQPVTEWFTNDTTWEAVKPLFEAFKRHPQMYWGLHPYWAEADLSPLNSSAIHRVIEPLLKRRGFEMPLIIFTEIGRDAVGGGKRNSWISRGITEEQFAAEVAKARNTLWTEPYIRGACIFCYGSSTTEWQSFDVEQAKILHSAIIGLNKTATPAPPPPADPPPVPVDLFVLQTVREHLNAVSNRSRQMSLQLAQMSDDLLKDVALLDALIKLRETPSSIPLLTVETPQGG